MEPVPAAIPEQRLLEDGSGVFPLTLVPPGAGATAASLAAWCERNCDRLRDLALRHGAVLLRGFGVNGAEDFAAVSRALNCEGYDYVGGAAPRTELVPGVVFTSNESPPDQPIPFHHELAQAPTPPAYILFHCERAAAKGGATPIIPSTEVAAFFEREFPDFARRVAEHGVRYIRVMPEVTDATSAQGRSWKETYNVSSREEAEAVMRKQGTSFEWLLNGDCRTTTAALPALRTDARTGRRTFFNSVVAAFTGWNDARNVGEKAVVLGDYSPVDADAIRAVARFMQERRVAFAWQSGDVLAIDNHLVMHARDTFEPPRRVLASLRGPPLQLATREAGDPTSAVATAQAAARAAVLGKQAGAGILRIGILGTGVMGREHIRNFAFLEDVAEVTAICDNDSRELAEAIKQLGPKADSCAIFSKDEDLVNCDVVDAIVACTPNYMHIDFLRRAINTDKHLLCEKPLCTTVEDCAEVERLLEQRDKRAKAEGKRPPVFMTGMEYRWMPPIARLIEEVDSGRHGKLHVLTIREHRFPFLVKVNNWNRFNKYTGGTLVEKACHFFDLMRRITKSEPVSVFASGGQALNHKDEVIGEEKPDILDHALVTVEFENGARCSLDLCMFAEDQQTEHVVAICERGKVEAKCPDSKVRLVRRKHVKGFRREPMAPGERAMPEVHLVPVPERLAQAGYHEGATFYELREFVEAAQGLRPVPVTAHDGKMAVLMGFAAQESIRLGSVVQLKGDTVAATLPPVNLHEAPLLAPSAAASVAARSRL